MKKRISLTHLLLAAISVFVFSKVGYADPLRITIGPGVNTFVFQNQLETQTAVDFEVTLVGDGPPGIGGGSGGAPFSDEPMFGDPLPGGGFRSITYLGSLGVPPQGMYTHSFVDWPVGTMFDVVFSYSVGGVIVFLEPRFIQQTTNVTNASPAQTRPVPEPTTLLLLGTGLATIAIKTRKRFKKPKGRY